MDGEDEGLPENVFPIRDELAWDFSKGVEWDESGPIVEELKPVVRASRRQTLLHGLYEVIVKSQSVLVEESIDEILRLFDQSPLTYEESKVVSVTPVESTEK